jgi:hypothetical protein
MGIDCPSGSFSIGKNIGSKGKPTPLSSTPPA